MGQYVHSIPWMVAAQVVMEELSISSKMQNVQCQQGPPNLRMECDNHCSVSCGDDPWGHGGCIQRCDGLCENVMELLELPNSSSLEKLDAESLVQTEESCASSCTRSCISSHGWVFDGRDHCELPAGVDLSTACAYACSEGCDQQSSSVDNPQTGCVGTCRGGCAHSHSGPHCASACEVACPAMLNVVRMGSS